MKIINILFDPSFEKKFKKYTNRLSNKELDNLRTKFNIIKENIFDHRLKTHKLKGNLKEYYALSITYSDRLVFKFFDDTSIYLIDIDKHDVVY